MIDAGASRDAFAASDAPAGLPARSLAIFSAAAVCAALAGCAAHERRGPVAETPAAPGASAEVALVPTQTTPTGRAVPSPQAAPAGQPTTPAAGKAAAKVGKSGGGLASWYGDRFHGRPTANGERFDMGGFTAAHRSFPLPSYVRVTNVSNGRSIVVRVNDRGPFHGGRVIDVSRRAADVLGFRSNGVGAVKLDLLGPAPESGSDDRRLLASYQEFGRPAAAPGTQVAMAPVSDQDFANEGLGYGGRAFAVASAAVTTSAAFVKSSAAAMASTAQVAVGKLVPAAAPAKPRAPETVAAAAPPVAAYAAEPRLASVPAALSGARVVAPSAPVLASAAPAPGVVAPTTEVRTASAMDVSSRIAAGFDGFDGVAPQLRAPVR